MVRPVGLVKCRTCNHVAAASEHRPEEPLEVVDASPGRPTDLVARVPLRCPMCGASGTLLVGYGASASPEEAEVLRHLFRRRLLVA